MITTWSRGEPDDGMAESILLDLLHVIPRHPWWLARARLTLAFLRRLGVAPPARVLDAGCGWGVTLSALERAGYRAEGLDVARQTLERLDQAQPGRILIEADLTRRWPDSTPVEPYDAVLALDVIEHLDDDQGAVTRLARLVRPGGALVVSVPALPDLFSEFDAIQGHRRRYTPETLRNAFAASGLTLETLAWWGATLAPLLKRQRRQTRQREGEPASATYLRYARPPRWPASALARLVLARDHRLTLSGRARTGSSLFALARRPPAA